MKMPAVWAIAPGLPAYFVPVFSLFESCGPITSKSILTDRSPHVIFRWLDETNLRKRIDLIQCQPIEGGYIYAE